MSPEVWPGVFVTWPSSEPVAKDDDQPSGPADADSPPVTDSDDAQSPRKVVTLTAAAVLRQILAPLRKKLSGSICPHATPAAVRA